MRQIKLSGNQRSGLSQFLFTFSITFGIGLVFLLLSTRLPAGKVGGLSVSSTKDKQDVSHLAVTETTDTEPPHAEGSLTDPALHDTSKADRGGSAVASTEQPPDQGIWYEDAAGNRRNFDARSSDPSTLRHTPVSNFTAASGFYESGDLNANTPVRRASSSAPPSPDPVFLPDADAVPYTYPPRRIAWHQGFSVEQQWYRSWYGWGASETP